MIPLKYNEIDLSNLVLSKMRKFNNQKSIYINYMKSDEISNLVFQTPEMEILNLNDFNTYYEINLKIEYEKMINFVDLLNNLDRYIINLGKQNSWWFYSNNVKYKGLIREGENKEYYLRLKILKSSLKSLRITKNKNVDSNIEKLKEGMKIRLILEGYGIWINKVGFGIYLKTHLIDYKEIIEYNLIEDTDDIDIIDTEVDDNEMSNNILGTFLNGNLSDNSNSKSSDNLMDEFNG